MFPVAISLPCFLSMLIFAGTKNSLAYMYFGGKIYANEVAQTMTNVSFGLSKDKFYKNNKYSVW